MFHIFFIYSLVIRHLGWFHSLAIVISAVINMDVQQDVDLYLDIFSGVV
jgi:hypothetical protein